MPEMIRVARFSINDGPSFEGFTDGETWNGFAMPMFTKEVALEVAKSMAAGNVVVAYNNETDTFYVLDTFYVQEEMDVCNAPIDPIHAKAITHGHTDEPVTVYDFGRLGWVWMEVEEPANV